MLIKVVKVKSRRNAKSPPQILRRYTTLSSLLHILHKKQITLLSPRTWDDRNDAFFLEQYRKCEGAKSVAALCFSMAAETYHHWRVFTKGSEGVCIEFDKQRLLAKINGERGLRARMVEYKLIETLEKKQPSADTLPFLKRRPYQDEREFRLVYSSHSEETDSKSFSIDLASIRRVTLSPWMPNALITPLKTTIHAIPGCSDITVIKTTLLENERWKKTATQVLPE